jgi:uncharacterized membrane protein YphA (DoxX/SURF4 family)
MIDGHVVLQGLLGTIFLFSGGFKFSGSPRLVAQWRAWRLPQWFRYVTGTVELAGGIGLLVGIGVRWLGPLAGLWLVATMLGALLTHLRVHDSASKMAPAALLLVLAAAVAVLGWPALAQQLA